MRCAPWLAVLLAGCAPPVEETAAALTGLGFLFLLPLVAAALFSTVTAWALIAAQQSSRATAAGTACLLLGILYAALCLGSVLLQADAAALADAPPIDWLAWPGPRTPGAAALLGLSGAVMLAAGGWAISRRWR